MLDELAGFLSLVSAFKQDGAKIVPPADAQDMQNGAKRIPGEVTDARRAGETCTFHSIGHMSQWYWEMPDGSHVMHGVYD